MKATAAIEAPMPTYLTVTGSLVANQQSEVAAGASGKVVKTLVERGSVVPEPAPGAARLPQPLAPGRGSAGQPRGGQAPA